MIIHSRAVGQQRDDNGSSQIRCFGARSSTITFGRMSDATAQEAEDDIQ